jgi:hypothetical protein
MPQKKSKKHPNLILDNPFSSKKFTNNYVSKQVSILFLLAFVIVGTFIVYKSLAATETNPQTAWAACRAGTTPYAPLSDSAAAALITHQPEVRPYNAKPYSVSGVTYPAANYYVPSDAELAAFQSAKNQYGQTAEQATYYAKFVDGRDGLTNPSTDDLIQWGAHKWGIPEDWLRAQYVQESYWNHFTLGDRTTESTAWFSQYPLQARVPGSSTDVYESMGLTQERWRPDNSDGIGTEPLRWKSTAFNIDFQGAQIRFYYDNPNGLRTTWGDASYVSCQQWNSLGGWFNPYPWDNSGQQSYVSLVQQHLNNRDWTGANFINASFTFPSVISFNSTPSTKLGDINSDNVVNILDLSILLSKYGTNDTTADINQDGSVNILDLSVLLSHYGT